MRLVLFIVAAWTFSATSARAEVGPGVSGGGDICEQRIRTIRDDLIDWIRKGGPRSLTLAAGFSLEKHYNKPMLGWLESPRTKIRCVGIGDPGYPVQVNGVAKTCRFDRGQFSGLITCSTAKFQATGESDQYVLIHHEYAGLAGLEKPEGDQSTYALSNQISGYLVPQYVLRLAVNPIRSAPLMQEECSEGGGFYEEFFDDVRNLRVACVKEWLRPKHGTGYTMSPDTKDDNQNTALHIVASASRARACSGKKGSEREMCDQAWKRKALEIANLLIDGGADLESRNHFDRTPIINAVQVNPELALLLAESGAKLTLKDKFGYTILHLTHDMRLISLFVKAGGDVNATDNYGATAIYFWIRQALIEEEDGIRYKRQSKIQPYQRAITSLVKSGADINLVRQNALPFDLKALKERGLDPTKFQMYGFLKSLGARVE